MLPFADAVPISAELWSRLRAFDRMCTIHFAWGPPFGGGTRPEWRASLGLAGSLTHDCLRVEGDDLGRLLADLTARGEARHWGRSVPPVAAPPISRELWARVRSLDGACDLDFDRSADLLGPDPARRMWRVRITNRDAPVCGYGHPMCCGKTPLIAESLAQALADTERRGWNEGAIAKPCPVPQPGTIPQH